MDAGELLLTIVVVAGLTLVLTLFARRQMRSSWSGRVEKVRERTRTHQNDEHDVGTTEHVVTVVVRTDAGKRVKVALPLPTFQHLFPTGLEVGDRVEKKSGAPYPALEV